MTATSVFAEQRDKMFQHLRIEIEFVDRLAGGSPKDPKLVEGWLRKGMGITDREELALRTRQHLREMGESLDEEMQKVVNDASSTMEDLIKVSEKIAGEIQTQGFKRDEEGRPYIEGRHLKAGIKETVNILFAGEKWGAINGKGSGMSYQGKGPKSFTAERVFVEPRQIVIGDPDDIEVDLFIGHINGPQGPQSTIGYYEFVYQKPVALEVLQLRSQKKGGKGEPALDPETWAKVWSHMELNGLGAMRSQGFGQFVVTKFEID